MASLEVDGRIVELGEGTLAIGSATDAGLVLSASWVAARHAQIDEVGGAHQITAEGIVLVGGNAIAVPTLLHDGDVLRLPDPSTHGLVTLIYRNPLAPRIAPIQHFAAPPGTARLLIGRGGDADIVLDQPLVSRHHAELLWQDSRHVLRDAGSAHGTFVNGHRVVGDQPLAPGDVVQIGTFRLTYDGDSLDSFDQRGAIRLDARDVTRVVGTATLLHPTTFSIEPCELVAIVGASGAGKSTLMTALCGFTRATGGTVAINGDDLYAGYDTYRSIIGYVPQDDILHRALSVDRALYHAARLRLPSDTGADEIAKRIAHVLAEVEMTEHSHKRIDQLSGGQRKRVSIACELLADPVLLFLDEPTSGLDPGLERKLMYTLRRLADGGRTIVLITHATQNINVCDHIAFLTAGRLVYFGPPSQALDFFGVHDFADIYAKIDNAGVAPGLETAYHASLQYQKYAIERPARASASGPSHEQRAEAERRSKSFAQSRWYQLRILTRRYLELIFADKKNLLLLLAQAPVIGALLVLVSTPESLTSGRIEAKKLIFMLATTGVWFGVINAAREICKEDTVLRRERLAGLRAAPYVASKLVVLSLLVLVQSALLLGVIALRTHLPPFPAAFELYAVIVLAGMAGIALGLCVSAVAATPDKATSLIPLVLVPQVVFAGIMFPLSGVTSLIAWAVSAHAGVDAMSDVVDMNDLAAPMMMPTDHLMTLATAYATLAAQTLVFSLVAWCALFRRR